VAVAAARVPFPFFPRHLTIVSALTIGIPGFFLALAKNTHRARAGFRDRITRFAVPAGTVAAAATFLAFGLARGPADLGTPDARTVATITLFLVALEALASLARPLDRWRRGLLASSAGAFALLLAVAPARSFFALPTSSPTVVVLGAAVGSAAAALLRLTRRLERAAGWAGDGGG
jgi:cation-transporting ATPase E